MKPSHAAARRPGRLIGAVVTVAIVLAAGAVPAGPARADETSPSPVPSLTSATPVPTQGPPPELSPTPESHPDPTPESAPAPTAASPSLRQRAEAAPASLTLRVTAGGSPDGRFWEDLGRYVFAGETAAGETVAIHRRPVGSAVWSSVATATADDSGSFSADLPVEAAGRFAFLATIGGSPDAADVASSPEVNVTVADATVGFTSAPASIDAVTAPALRGRVVPARAGVVVALQAVRAGRYATVASARSAADGGVTIPFRYGLGSLASYRIRLVHKAANRDRYEVSAARTLTRVKVLAARVTPTTAAEVAKTYRGGCPVGPSKLRTIAMNYYGYDQRMHRGVMIVRSSIVTRTIRSFGRTLRAGFPIAKMNNPNVYGGNDPRQMAANNTSGFNCRKVVGNPYRMSPHSYGIAIDVNTVQNPYRDRNGTWWPKEGKRYRDRSPLKKGMLGKKSTLTRSLKAGGFFWGGRWNPGRDYQHFEKR